MNKFIFLFLTCCILPLSAGSPIYTDLSTLKKFVAAKKEKPRSNQPQIDQTMRRIQFALKNKRYTQALTQIKTLIKLEPKSLDASVALSEEIFSILIKQSKEEVERKEKLYKDFAKAMIEAKATRDIDPWLVKLNAEIKIHQPSIAPQPYIWSPSGSPIIPMEKYQNYWSLSRSYTNYRTHSTQLQTHANSALQIAGHWQDYLQHLNNEDLNSAKSQLRYIARLTTQFTYIPRSTVLALESGLLKQLSPKSQRSQKPLTMKDVKKRLTTKESTLTLASELRNRSSSQLDPAVQAFKESLSNFKYAVNYLDSGNLNSGFEKLNSLATNPLLGDLTKQLRSDYLKTFLKTPKDFAIKNNEHVDVWSMRYLKQLATQKKWRKIQDALKVLSQANSRNRSSYNSSIKADLDATGYLIAGQNYEANEQYLRAIVAFRQAVGKTGNLKLVTEEAGKRLRALQKAHPTEHAQSQSLRTHDGTSNSFTTSHTLIRKVVEEEVRKAIKAKQVKQK